MTKPALIWGIPAVVYVLFFLWYTPLGGPLTEAEIDAYLAALPGENPERKANIRDMLVNDSGTPLVMVNVIDMDWHNSSIASCITKYLSLV